MTRFRKKRLALTVVGSLMLAAVGGLVPNSVQAHHAFDPAQTSCRSSAMRLDTTTTGLVEPLVANDTGTPCQADAVAPIFLPFVIPGVPLPPPAPQVPPLVNGSITVLGLGTNLGGTAGHPEANVGNVVLDLSSIGGPLITAEVTGASAAVGPCSGQYGTPGSKPTMQAASVAVNVSVAGTAVPVTGTPNQVIPVPFGTLTINEQTITANQATARALHGSLVGVPLVGDVEFVVAEAGAGWAGTNPCQGVPD